MPLEGFTSLPRPEIHGELPYRVGAPVLRFLRRETLESLDVDLHGFSDYAPLSRGRATQFFTDVCEF